MMIAVALTARPSYAKLKPVLDALVARHADVTVLACASALLERYGRVVDVVRRDFPSVPIVECWSTYEGSTLLTSAKETGALLSEAATALERLRPNRVLVCADRHEVLAVAQAARYLHLELWHMQGGESSGSVDDVVRNAITQLADFHLPCTELARHRVYALTGAWERIFQFGCPSIDVAKQAQADPPVTVEELGGAGAPIDLAQPFGVLLQHPVTSEADQAYAQMRMTIEAWPSELPCLAFWPGQDAGSEGASKAIREMQAHIHTVRNLPPARFLRLLTQCAVLGGNSSAGIREAGYLGTPVVDIGSRQFGRERGPNVGGVNHIAHSISYAIELQVEHGRYPSSPLYGQGQAGVQIAEVLADVTGDRVDSRSVRLEGHPGQELPTL